MLRASCRIARLLPLTLIACLLLAATAAQAQTLTVLHTFTGEHSGHDGAHPMNGLVMDADGNLYGTTQSAGDMSHCLGEGDSGCGTVWKLTP